MKRLQHIKTNHLLLLLCCFGLTTFANAQQEYEEQDPDAEPEAAKNQANYKLGSGLDFSFNDGDYHFGVTGFIQPGFLNESTKGFEDVNQFRSKRTFLQFDGNAIKEKVSFFVQLDFSLSNPLMDAWLAYEPIEQVKISFGQKQTFVNNREMLYREDRLQFANRSFLSQTLSETGREFGVFVESNFEFAGVGIAPMAALTSGDGRNSFGDDSRDSDIGGLKLGGRLDIYPLGYFKAGNELTSVDLEREDTLKFVVGVAGSQNYGASGPTGEGHGDFFLFDANGNDNLPDYRQFYVDLLAKYKGFSLLAEYANASATGIDEVYLDESATQILAPGQISEFLALGDSYNFQVGYVTKNGYSFDLSFNASTPEFENSMSVLNDFNATTLGFTKYFYGNSLKLQTSYSIINPSIGETINQFEILFQIAL
ncbi:hypothetical protein [Winogradskyella aurantia]|uniref:Porin n=1 Tax=Winogradskyella aurantia TaxID=1915063 RepID=A0A265UZT4_9FLAO|nr:hypothetical protein [Winogradskyella aurantia]OZV70577.1 hypothetical protein CA834_00225 [Winogradskyella aurantia]